MEQHDILFSSATDLAHAISSGALSSFEVVSAFLDQIGKYNGRFNAVVTLNRDNALAEARAADRDFAEGRLTGKLHGLPVTIKDNYRTKGLRTTSGYTKLKDYLPDEDAEIVKLLKAEGAIIIGKTNLSVLAMDMQTDNPIFGRTNNPWDISRTPGGSSGGCATALATGMTPLSFGNDLAGSIRLPSSFCGVYGFKPTFGVVPFRGVQMDPEDRVNGIRSLACAGPLARGIDDLEFAMGILAGTTRECRRVAPLVRAKEEPDSRQLNIAWTDFFGGVPVDAETQQIIRNFVSRVSEAGIRIERAIPDMDFHEVWKTWGSIVGMQGNYRTSNLSRTMGSIFTSGVLKDVPMHQNIVKPMSVEKYMMACDRQDLFITVMENFLKEYDLFICPVSATAAFEHHAPSRSYGSFNVYNEPLRVNGMNLHYYMATQAFTTPFNVTESPVLVIPAGMNSRNLPVGIQLVGRRYDDFRLLKIGKLLNRYTDPIMYPLSVKSDSITF